MGRKFIGNVKGVGVKSAIKEYYLSDSPIEMIGGNWLDYVPVIESGQYLWSRWKISYTDNSVEHTDGVQEGVAGEQLEQIAALYEQLAPGGDLASTRQRVNYIGLNPITTAEDDTLENWFALGTGIAHCGGNGLFPTDNGFLVNMVDDGENISQVWIDLVAGEGVWRRHGDARSDYISRWIKDTELKLLWENPDCTQNFEGQTVSPYDPYKNAFPTIIVALFNVSTSNVRKVFSISIVGTYGEVQWTGNVDSASETYFATRRWLLGTGGDITFGNAIKKQGSTTSEKNDILIPHSVYSIGAYHGNWS